MKTNFFSNALFIIVYVALAIGFVFFAENTVLAANNKILFGAYSGSESGLPGNPYTWDQFESDSGKKMNIWGSDTWWYVFSWGDFNTLYKEWADKTIARGSMPLIMWQPYNPCRGDPCCDPADASCSNPTKDCSKETCTFGIVKETDKDYISHIKKYSLKNIVAGNFDSYIRTWAKQIKAWGKPVMIRPMHEMNTIGTVSSCWGNDSFAMSHAAILYDTDCSTKINQPQDAVNAWRHIVDIFRDEGVTNVTWLWTLLSWPSVSYGGNNPTSMASIYPGDDYVDWIGIECYNFGSGWTECSDAIIANAYREASALSLTKPLMMAEMGSAEKSGNSSAKPNWIKNALCVNQTSSIYNRYPRVKAVFWWNDSNLAVETSPQSIAAFKECVSSSIYGNDSDAQFISQNVPSTMVAGKTYTISVTMKNIGSNPWTAAENYRLGSQNPQDNWIWRSNRVYLGNNESIMPGQSKTFTFDITAPSAPGTYNFQWKMVREWIEWFGKETTNVQVVVAKSQVAHLQILSTGQSLSFAGIGGAISTSQPYGNLMLSPNVEGVDSPFIPLIENYSNSAFETPSSGMANSLYYYDSLKRPVVVGLHGVGGTKYSGLKKGTAPYANGIAQATKTKSLVEATGGVYKPIGVTVIHGESDSSNWSEYEANLKQWQNDYQTDINALTGSSAVLPMFISQMNQMYVGDGNKLAVAQLDAHKDNPGKIIMVGPKYQYGYYKDNNDLAGSYLHLTNKESKHVGEMFAKVIKKVFFDGKTWNPLMPTEITRNGSTITISYNIPVGTLAIDTINVAKRPNYGFEFAQTGGNSVSISSVQLANNNTQVQIKLSAVPTGTDQRMRYAWTCYAKSGYCGDATNANFYGGNIRDTDSSVSPEIGSTGVPLYDWSVTFDEPVAAVCTPKSCATLGNYQCGSWSDGCGATINCGACAANKTCSNGKCVSSCSSHSSKKCDSGDLYWYNSCNTKEELAQDCGNDQPTSVYRCNGSWRQRETIKKVCTSNACASESAWANDTDCAASGKTCKNGVCVASCTNECITNAKRCDGNGVQTCAMSGGCLKWSTAVACGTGKTCNAGVCQTACTPKTCATLGNYQCGDWSDGCGKTINCGSCATNKTCSNGKCVTNCTPHSAKKCESGKLYWYNSCNAKEGLFQDCGTDQSTTNYRCSGNWIQRETVKKGCGNNVCTSESTWTNEVDCNTLGKVCISGVCNTTCTPGTCARLGYFCGSANDGCGNTLDCGTCGSNQICQSGVCVTQLSGEGEDNGDDGGGSLGDAKTAAKMTRAEIIAKINEIVALIAKLQEQLKAITGSSSQNAVAYQGKTYSCAKITKVLRYGMKNDSEVKCLQEVLKSQNYAVTVSGNYDLATKNAVKLFQEKYASEILTPYGLRVGSGNVGNSTMEKINIFLAK